jgi:predicted transcriptional regulator
MNTEKHPPLSSTRINEATNILRVFNHRFRFKFLNGLMSKGKMSSGQIAEQHSLDHPYVDEQMSVLHDFGLVEVEQLEEEVYFSANEKKVKHIQSVVANFNEKYW